MKRHYQNRMTLRSGESSRQGGAVIIVVLSLLTTLTFLGLFFWNWTSQDVANAEIYAASDSLAVTLNPDTVFDDMAEQLIVGTRYGYEASALWGGMHSMLAHEIGRIQPSMVPEDMNVRSGTGIITRFTDSDGDGYPDIDTSTGGFTDPNDYQFQYNDFQGNVLNRNIANFVLNYSFLAQSNHSVDAFNQPSNPVPYYRPDADYTYPDVNSLFLAYENVVRADVDDSSNLTERRVLIPSFFRPQLFPGYRATDGSSSFQTLYLSSDASAGNRMRQVFRPHQSHGYQLNDGSFQRRYLLTATRAASGDQTRMLQPFPFPSSPGEAQMGVFSNVGTQSSSEFYSLLDVDLDSDGIKDSIWMDLGLPMIELPEGREVVPIASFKVIDADGLLNLNVHGNVQGATVLSRSVTSGTEPISISNLGVSRSEVNPLWALNGDVNALSAADKAAALKNVQDRYGSGSVPANPTRLQLANMEWGMLATGLNSASSGLVLGRYGDAAAMQDGNPTTIPQPGATQLDDDSDDKTGGNGGFGQVDSSDPDVGNRRVDGFVHPLSLIGLGLGTYQTPDNNTLSYLTAGGKVRLTQPLSSNPASWPQYVNFQDLPNSQYPTALRPINVTVSDLIDEDDEMVIEPGSLYYGLQDEPFPSSALAWLHLRGADRTNLASGGRISELAKANFQYVSNADDIRSRFTTNSWDRSEFSFPSPPFRTWEWGANDRFPTEFAPGSGSVEPFRKEIRDLMRTDFQGSSDFGGNRLSPRHRLNLNRILSDDATGGGGQPAFVSGSPRYRQLVPHPDDISTGTATTLTGNPMYHGDNTPPVPFSMISADVCAQEWWARYDRQRLARDIYCLLWVLACDNSGSTLSANPYNAGQTREMAQFAVNVVDAIDRDDVITEFEYDANLLDGWSTNPTETVYGIEHQQLAFNEVLFIHAQQQTDSNRTAYDDDSTTDVMGTPVGGHFFSFVELRNATPWAIPIDDGTWRIRRMSVDGNNSELFKATLQRASGSESIGAGAEFLISCQSGDNKFSSGNMRPSDFRVDHNNDSSYDLIVPNETEMTVPNNGTPEANWEPQCDLDLMHADDDDRTEEPAFTAATSLLNRVNFKPGDNIRLVLERRLRPDESDTLNDATNPWIEVDRIEGTVREFNVSDITSLDDLVSQERREVYDAGNDISYANLLPLDYNGGAAGTAGKHTLPYHTKGSPERKNSRANDPFTIWQPHFDRDFSSVMELLSVPLYGNFRSGIGDTWSGPVNGGAVKNVAEPGGTLRMSGHRTAAMRFFHPEATPGASGFQLFTGVAGAEHYQNRWYRFLEYVTVKSQNTLRTDPLIAVQRRTPGKVNLNTIRDESVMAGLIDDPFHIDPRNKTYPKVTQDQLDTGRYWYEEHLLARDGTDPFMDSAGYTVRIPGSFNSRPYHSLGYLGELTLSTPTPDLSIQSTILRMRDSTEGHGLFEARPVSDVGTDQVDFHTRQRILAKIANNTTTKSHVFLVWMGFDLFTAHRSVAGNVQIGARAEDLPSYRMFCVVDMSRLEEAYDPNTQTFDFRKFIIHRQLLP